MLVGKIVCLMQNFPTTLVTKGASRCPPSKPYTAGNAGPHSTGPRPETVRFLDHLVRQHLKTAQSRQKIYYDGKHRQMDFEVGKYVYLKVTPLKGMKRFQVKGKLAPRFIGPFMILARRGNVAYQLELPENLCEVHNVFHIS